MTHNSAHGVGHLRAALIAIALADECLGPDFPLQPVIHAAGNGSFKTSMPVDDGIITPAVLNAIIDLKTSGFDVTFGNTGDLQTLSIAWSNVVENKRASIDKDEMTQSEESIVALLDERDVLQKCLTSTRLKLKDQKVVLARQLQTILHEHHDTRAAEREQIREEIMAEIMQNKEYETKTRRAPETSEHKLVRQQNKKLRAENEQLTATAADLTVANALLDENFARHVRIVRELTMEKILLKKSVKRLISQSHQQTAQLDQYEIDIKRQQMLLRYHQSNPDSGMSRVRRTDMHYWASANRSDHNPLLDNVAESDE